MSLSEWARLLRFLDQLPELFAQVADHESRVKGLEDRMTTSESVITRIDAVTTAMGTDVGTLRQKLADLTAAVQSGNQAAVSSALDALAPSIANLEAMETTLHALGSDPANPVPPDAPTEPAVDPSASGAATESSADVTAATEAQASADTTTDSSGASG
jgi:uncharacterized coiled-coil protein SlyX